MVSNLPRSQYASATRFMPSYFKPGNSQHGSGMHIIVSIQFYKINNFFKNQFKNFIFLIFRNQVPNSIKVKENPKLKQQNLTLFMCLFL